MVVGKQGIAKGDTEFQLGRINFSDLLCSMVTITYNNVYFKIAHRDLKCSKYVS
jgi:hypothetical protein